VTPGYLGAPEETAAILHDGWLWTGDLARRDDDGFLFLVGRSKEIMKIGGHRVSPIEIEHVLAEHPAVARAAVVGVPDAVQGEIAVGFVVPHAGGSIDEQELRRFCRERLPAFKVPSHIRSIDSIPSTEAGKPLKAELSARARAIPTGGTTR
jgi:acyl-CoA synthetase (AMP-forming)/AMP-acid ligase II